MSLKLLEKHVSQLGVILPDNIWTRYRLTQQGRGKPLTSSEQRLGTLLHLLQRTGQLRPPGAQHRMIQSQMSIVLRVRNLVGSVNTGQVSGFDEKRMPTGKALFHTG